MLRPGLDFQRSEDNSRLLVFGFNDHRSRAVSCPLENVGVLVRRERNACGAVDGIVWGVESHHFVRERWGLRRDIDSPVRECIVNGRRRRNIKQRSAAGRSNQCGDCTYQETGDRFHVSAPLFLINLLTNYSWRHDVSTNVTFAMNEPAAVARDKTAREVARRKTFGMVGARGQARLFALRADWFRNNK
jgi:hypothetical protein